MDFVSNFWNWISYLGLNEYKGSVSGLKRLALTNRINFIICILAILVFSFLLIFSQVEISKFNFNQYRILFAGLLALINLILSFSGLYKLSRFFLIFIPVLLLSILPIFFGVVNDESYLDFPWIIITASMTPHFVLSPKENKALYYVSLLYYLVLLIPLENLLAFYFNPEVHILPVVQGNLLYMKLAQLSIYGFLNLCIIYLQSLNRQHETNLERANELLSSQSVIINQQSGELKATNMQLLKHQEEMKLNNKNLIFQNMQLENTLHELKETQAQLVQAEKLATIGMLTAGIAHEINNPINFINSGLEGLRVSFQDCYQFIEEALQILDSEDTQKLCEIERLNDKYDIKGISESIPILLSNIQTGSTRAAEIVRSLLFFTHSSEDKIRPANIHESIDASLVMLNHLMKDRIEIVKHYLEIPLIYCLRSRINQVFMNLLTNAVQAMDGPGQLVIFTENIQGNESVRIRIRDTGKGIPADIQNKIFDPFFSTKETGKGTGLGLYIVMKIIKEHNGNLTYESIEGKGTEFIVELPVKPDSLEEI